MWCGHKSGKRAVLLAVILSLGLTACGSREKEKESRLPGTVYVPKFTELKLAAEGLSAGCADSRNIYLAANANEAVPADSAAANYVSFLYRIPLEGGEAVKLEQYQPVPLPEGTEGNVSIQELSVGTEDTLWVTENVYSYTFRLPEGFNEETDDKWQYQSDIQETVIRRQLDAAGKELKRVDISGLAQKLDVDTVYSTAFDRDGNIYAVTEKKIFALDPGLQVLFTVEGKDMTGALTPLGDGTLGMICSSYNEETQTSDNVLKTIDPKKKALGAEYPMPLNAYGIQPGRGAYQFYYQNGDTVYGCRAGAKEGEKLFSWVDSNINQDDINFCFPLEDGRVAAVSRKWEQDTAKYELVLMTPTDRSSLPEKTTLTYGTAGLSWEMRRKIIDFNKTNDKYRIEVRDYSQLNTGDDNAAGIARLNMDMMAGNGPDILDMGALPIRQYGAKGLLEDLWPFIEKDKEIGREKLMEKVFEAAQQDGKLFQILENFGIQTVAGAREVVGDRMSWTLHDLKEARKKMPEGCAIFGMYDTRESMLQTVLYQSMGSFVDWTKGECSFDSDGFKALLEFCGSFPGSDELQQNQEETYESDSSRILSRKQMLAQITLYDLGWTYQEYKAAFGGDISFIGYPREDGSTGSTFCHSAGLAMSGKCRDKEGAWIFMRRLLLPRLTEENNHSDMMPTNKADFEFAVRKAMEPQYQVDEEGKQVLDENGNPIPLPLGKAWISDSVEIELPRPSQEDYDRFMELYNATSSVNYQDENITKIITEEAAAYFSGDRTLEDIARQIQSRVSLYVNENR